MIIFLSPWKDTQYLSLPLKWLLFLMCHHIDLINEWDTKLCRWFELKGFSINLESMWVLITEDFKLYVWSLSNLNGFIKVSLYSTKVKDGSDSNYFDGTIHETLFLELIWRICIPQASRSSCPTCNIEKDYIFYIWWNLNEFSIHSYFTLDGEIMLSSCKHISCSDLWVNELIYDPTHEQLRVFFTKSVETKTGLCIQSYREVIIHLKFTLFVQTHLVTL